MSKVALDLDGVIYKWIPTAKYLLNTEFRLKLGEVTHWDYIKEQVTPEQWNWLQTVGVERGLYRYGHLYKGAKSFVDRLSAEHEVIIVTSRPRVAAQDTLDWLAFMRLGSQEVRILGRGAKKSVVEAEVYVDDSPRVAQDIVQNTFAHMVLIGRPWNREYRFPLCTEYRTVRTVEHFGDGGHWSQVLSYLEERT